MRRRWSAVAACALILTACGSGGARVVPWVDLAAADVAKPFTLPGVAACTAADVAVSVHVADPSYVGAGPVDTSSWVLDVCDRSGRRCFVGAQPEVSFSRGGRRLDIPRAPDDSNGDIVYLTAYTPHALGEIAVTPCVLHGVDRISVAVGGRLGGVDVDGPGPPGGTGRACPAPHETYTASLRGTDVTGSVAAATQTTLQAPRSIHPGETVGFTVTLDNTPMFHSQAAGTVSTPNPTLTWQRCPSYHQELEGIAGTFHTYRLDCAAATPVAAGARETFAMSITVPADAQPGPATLVWSLDGSPAQYQTARLDVEIE